MIWATTAAIVVANAVHEWRDVGAMIDLEIYREAALAKLQGSDLYGLGFGGLGLPFSYPPFALIVLLPLAGLPFSIAVVAWYALSLVCLAVTFRMCLRAVGATDRWSVASLLASAALVLHPYGLTVHHGQVSLLLLLLVVWDATGERTPLRGMRIGVAGAIKLTPLVFIPWLALAHGRRSAITAAFTFGLCSATAWFVLASDSNAYWLRSVFEAAHMGNLEDPINQSWNGALHRAMDGDSSLVVWLPIAAATMLVGYVVASRLARRGLLVASVSAVGIAGLLASPISWPHHWVWVVPAAIGCWPARRELPWLWRASIVLVAVTAASSDSLRANPLVGEAYVAAGCLWLVAALWAVTGSRTVYEQPLVLPQLPHT